MRLGIFGGTFNPIHLGHLLLAETARDALALDRMLFIPAGQPPHKPARGLLPGAVRVRMIELAIRDHPAFAVSDVELKRSGPSYTIDTLKLLRTKLPDAKLFLLIGQDMLAVRWFAWSQVKRLCTVVAVRRSGARAAKTQRGVTWLTMPQVGIASSDIRIRVREGRSIRYLVPAAVARYIRQHELYARGGMS